MFRQSVIASAVVALFGVTGTSLVHADKMGVGAAEKHEVAAHSLAVGKSTKTYDETMKDLQKATDRLYDAIHKMAREPAGPDRTLAIKDANAALVKAQAAMAWVADQEMASSGQHGTTHSAAASTQSEARGATR